MNWMLTEILKWGELAGGKPDLEEEDEFYADITSETTGEFKTRWDY